MQSKKVFAVSFLVVVLLAVGGWKWWSSVRLSRSADQMKLIQKAYDTNQFQKAEQQAEQIVNRFQNSKDPKERQRAAEARYVMAFAAARQHKMKLARERFAVLQKEASKLPGKGKLDPPPGWDEYSLEEEAAYQHAVCTSALGDKKAAEAELVQFIKKYPDSVLIHGAVKRIARYHGGDVPPEAEAAWNHATGLARKKRQELILKESMCGPECLAELLRRKGETIDVKALAKEMKTTELGTTMKDLAAAAKKHGFHPKGLSLTQKGLEQQKLPVIAFLSTSHFVIVDEIFGPRITVWDPSANGSGKPGNHQYTPDEWKKVWKGIALSL